jgi:hypothetical protein
MALKACTSFQSINQPPNPALLKRIPVLQKSAARRAHTARVHTRRDFLVANNFSRPADKCNVALYFINKGAVDELYEIIYGRCFLYRAHEWKSLSRGT